MERKAALFAEPARAESTHYDLLMELSRGRLGQLQLARATSRSASRHMLMRQVAVDWMPPLSGAIARGNGVAHPRWLKTVGFVSVTGVPYLVSEHVAGLPLSELLKVVQALRLSVVPEVALRIVLDALHAASAAGKLLGEGNPLGAYRYIYAESLWVATFGETLLVEPGIAQAVRQLQRHTDPELRVDCTWATPEELRGEAARLNSDVFAAGGVLWELLTGRPLPELGTGEEAPRLDGMVRAGRRLLPSIVQLVARALSSRPEERFTDVDDMADAIESLPARWIGTDSQVQAAVEPLVHLAPGSNGDDESEELNSGRHSIDPWDTPTRSMRAPFASDVEPTSTRPTVRPPRSGAA